MNLLRFQESKSVSRSWHTLARHNRPHSALADRTPD